MMDIPDHTFGGQIRVARERKGISRTKLAEFAGVPSNSLVRYEKAGEEGGKYPPLILAAKICKILEIDPRRAFDTLLELDDVNRDDDFRFTHYFFQLDFVTAKEHGWPDAIGPSLFEKLDQLQADLTALRAKIESGSDHNDPSRVPKTHSGAVPAAPGQHLKQKEVEDDQE